jgi:hypothetical protein
MRSAREQTARACRSEGAASAGPSPAAMRSISLRRPGLGRVSPRPLEGLERQWDWSQLSRVRMGEANGGIIAAPGAPQAGETRTPYDT